MTETLIILAFLVTLFLNFYVIDRLFEYEFREYHDQWIVDGKPGGFFWNPKGTPFLSWSFFVRSSRLSSWFFVTPDWIKGDRYANFLMWLHRLLIVLLFAPYICWKTIL